MEATAKVNPGVCGFETTIRATSDDGMTVALAFETECKSMMALAEKLAEMGEINAYEEMSPAAESKVLSMARELLVSKGCCEACVVPASAVKAMQVVAGLALPKDCAIAIEKA